MRRRRCSGQTSCSAGRSAGRVCSVSPRRSAPMRRSSCKASRRWPTGAAERIEPLESFPPCAARASCWFIREAGQSLIRPRRGNAEARMNQQERRAAQGGKRFERLNPLAAPSRQRRLALQEERHIGRPAPRRDAAALPPRAARRTARLTRATPSPRCRCRLLSLPPGGFLLEFQADPVLDPGRLLQQTAPLPDTPGSARPSGAPARCRSILSPGAPAQSEAGRISGAAGQYRFQLMKAARAPASMLSSRLTLQGDNRSSITPFDLPQKDGEGH